MKRSFEKEFGFNFTDSTKPVMKRDHFLRTITDEKQREIVDQICCEITKGMPTDRDLFDILKDLPAELSMDILCQLNAGMYLQVDEMLINFYFDRFVKDVNTVDKKGNSKFENRIYNQNKKNVNDFYQDRLLGLMELESIFTVIYKKDQTLTDLGLFRYYKYQGENKYIKILIEARKKISHLKAEANDYILNTISTKLLEKVLSDLKELNIALE